MPFENGQSGNPKGRKPGTKNKVSAHSKERLKELIDQEIETLPEHFALIDDPYKRLSLLSKFLPFVYPKMRPIEQEEAPREQGNVEVIIKQWTPKT